MKHWTIGSVALTAFVALVASGVARAAQPDKAAKGGDKQGEHGKAGEHGRAKSKKGEHPPTAKDERAEGGAEARPVGHGLGKGHGHHASAMRALCEDLKHGKVKKGELKERLAALHASREERQKTHRAELGERWGKSLDSPPAHEELSHHARRSAFLNRALVVAETEAKVKEKDKLVARIEKLIEKENARHDQAMQRFPAAPEPSTQPAAAPTLNVPAKGTEP
jgi:hypothetical protein